MEERSPYNLKSPPLLIVISGPAGVGKDSVIQRLKERGCALHFVVTATDRTPRPGEAHGVDYFFLPSAEFLRMKREQELLEHAVVYGQHKGVPKQQIREALASGKDVIMRVDVQGAATVRRLVPEALLIFSGVSRPRSKSWRSGCAPAEAIHPSSSRSGSPPPARRWSSFPSSTTSSSTATTSWTGPWTT